MGSMQVRRLPPHFKAHRPDDARWDLGWGFCCWRPRHKAR